MKRVLFILKRREDIDLDPSYSKQGVSTGLLNSATFVHDMLGDIGVESKLVVVTDNNDIDREVTLFRPTHVIVEALWVVPEKFDVLTKLHPHIKWIIRFHSETPFIASEGIAMGWLHGYTARHNVYIGINAPRFMREVGHVLIAAGMSKHEVAKRIIYLPNYYPVERFVENHVHVEKDTIDVGCFGAIRPLKNHLIQAIAAVHFAESIGKKLNFHINIGRVEMKGEPILNNLTGLFSGLSDNGHNLVVHQWMPHGDFKKVIAEMDIGLQVSFSETFNIVAADMITAGIPMVMSKEIPWAVLGIADPTDSDDIYQTLRTTWGFRQANVIANRYALERYVRQTKRLWKEVFQD